MREKPKWSDMIATLRGLQRREVLSDNAFILRLIQLIEARDFKRAATLCCGMCDRLTASAPPENPTLSAFMGLVLLLLLSELGGPVGKRDLDRVAKGASTYLKSQPFEAEAQHRLVQVVLLLSDVVLVCDVADLDAAETAVGYLDDALDVCDSAVDWQEASVLRWGLGTILCRAGRIDEGIMHLATARDTWLRRHYCNEAAEAESDIGLWRLRQWELGQLNIIPARQCKADYLAEVSTETRQQSSTPSVGCDVAIRHLLNALRILEQDSNTRLEGHLYHRLGLATRSKGDFDESIAWFQRAVSIREREGPTESEAESRVQLAHALFDRAGKGASVRLEDLDKAAEEVDCAFRVLDEAAKNDWLGTLQLLKGRILLRRSSGRSEDRETAIQCLEVARAQFGEHGDTRHERQAVRELARARSVS
jgi:tetratricopeptide (TPR) repeat protein